MSKSEPITSGDSDSDDSDGLGLDALYNVEKKYKYLSFDMWGSCRADNLQDKLKENQKLKPVRVHLMKLVTDYFNNINVKYFIYGGTALAVYREGGRMIEHDGDIDIAILEADYSSAVKSIDSFTALNEGDVVMSNYCQRNKNDWFEADGSEIPYNGIGVKRVIFFATRKLLAQFGIPVDGFFDVNLVHLDVFTLGQHPDNSNCFCVNWNIPGHYDYRKKAYPKSIFFPLRTYSFEGLDVYGMNDLKVYLEIEYGYIGRGATYDPETQLYVKISDSVVAQLSSDVQRWSMASNSPLPEIK